MTKINPYEIALLEYFISISYFENLRDVWGEMVKHVEVCLDEYMLKLSPNHRSTPLPYQADIVWGWRVIPNFRSTLDGLIDGFIMLSHGNAEGYAYAHSVRGDFKGQLDYDTEWMGTENEKKYQELIHQAISIAHNISLTEGAYWSSLYLYEPHELGLPNVTIIPGRYKINTSISVKTGEKTLVSGIYVPDIENSCPEFLSIKYKQAPACYVLTGFQDVLDPTTGKKCGEEPQHEKHPCTWFLIERETDSPIRSAPASLEDQIFWRARSGEACPQTGYYFTPAQSNSRRMFQQGDIMPVAASGYGATIWQWDNENQA